MKEHSKFKVGSIVGIILLFVALPLFAKQGLAESKPDGTLNIAMAHLGEEGFLADMGDVEQGRIWPLVYEYLYYLDSKTREPIPGLANRMEYSKDNLTLTIYLREGIPWQDTEKWGQVTAEDVKYTFERLTQSASSLISTTLKTTVKSIEIVSRYVVALHLKKTSPDLWMDISGASSSAPPIMCKKYIETVGADKARYNPIGSGPYRLVDHETGEYLKFQALEKHWRVVPEFKYIVVHLVPEESTRIAMLKTGEIDIAPVSALSMAGIRNTPGLSADLWPGGYTIFGYFGGTFTPKDKRYKAGVHAKDPWVDKRVREAMRISIDREGIAKAVYRGGAKPMTLHWALPGYEKLPPIPYDPERAKRLLAEAGYPNGFPVKVIATSAWSPAFEIPKVMEVVAANFRAIGLQVRIVPMDKVQQLNQSRAGKNAGMILPWKETYQISYSGRHYQKFVPNCVNPLFQSDALTPLIDEYLEEIDQKKRAAALDKVRDYHYNEKTTIPLILASGVWAWRNKKVGEWPVTHIDKIQLFEYVRHAKPLNTWRLFTP